MLLTSACSAQDLEIVNIRVGQGDSTLILGPETPDGSRVKVLFDAGNTPKTDIDGNRFDGGDILRTVLSKRNIKTIDFFVLSHDDADHLGGLVTKGIHGRSFLFGFDNVPGSPGDDDGNGIRDWTMRGSLPVPDRNEYGLGDDIKVLKFVDYGDDAMRDTQAIKKYKILAETLAERIEVSSQDDVNKFQIDLGGGAKMTCYASNGFVRGNSSRVAKVDRANEKSMSFLVTYGDFDFLISGDLIGRRHGAENAKVEERVGAAILRDGRDVDILHVNHHGANNGSSKKFLEQIKPHIAIISSGNGTGQGPKHPHNDTLKRLVDAGVYRIFQTAWGKTEHRIPARVRDRQAIWQQDIVVRSDGTNYWVETSRMWEAKD